MAYYSLYEDSNYGFYGEGEGDVWVTEPTKDGLIVYSIITPCICLLGILGSTVTLLVLLRQELKASIYTYLAVLAFADLVLSILLLISGLCKGALWYNSGFPQYDAVIGLPLGGFFSCMAISATVCVSIDRAVFLWNPRRFVKPKFCKRRVARKLMIAFALISLLTNIPYCFIYAWNDDGTIRTTEFFNSPYYTYHNWMKFILFGLIPCITLIFGNGFLIHSMKKAYHMRQKCQRACNKSSKKYKKMREQSHVTLTLIAIVFFFIIGEFPTHFVSRKSAVTILFGGDESAASASQQLETFRQVSIVLNAADIAVNFFLYCMFCPTFGKTLRKMTRPNKKDRKKSSIHANNVQVNVFVLKNEREEVLDMKPSTDQILDLLAIQVERNTRRNSRSNSSSDDDDDDDDDNDDETTNQDEHFHAECSTKTTKY